MAARVTIIVPQTKSRADENCACASEIDMSLTDVALVHSTKQLSPLYEFLLSVLMESLKSSLPQTTLMTKVDGRVFETNRKYPPETAFWS